MKSNPSTASKTHHPAPQSVAPVDHIACLLGSGIVCGLQVYVDKHCAIHVNKGIALTSSGMVVQQEDDVAFHYYLPYDKAREFKEHLPCAEGLDNFSVYKMLQTKVGEAKPFSPQNMKAMNANSFLEDKVVVAYLEGGQKLTYLLLSQKDAAKILSLRDELKEVVSQKPQLKPSLRPGSGAYNFTEEDYDKAMRPQLLLKEVHFRRFGFEALALVDKDKPADAINLVNCFWEKIGDFATIHAEYAAIVEEAVDQINDALEYLHNHPAFYPLLTHKPKGYFKPYLSVLVEKWTLFISSPHLHKYPEYIQYFYDWAKDLADGYAELKAELDDLTHACCGDDCHPWHVLLGKVKGGTSEYTPSIFRQELVQPPVYNGSAERLRKVKLYHWRLMMMIRTFDLPHLRLDEMVLAKHFPPTDEEADSTNEIERDKVKNLDEVKITPSRGVCGPLGSQSIPYYYPIANDNIYSLHLYWDYSKARNRRTDEHLTYNAFATGYTKKDFVLQPLNYPLECMPFLRVEGHIGKQFTDVETKLRELKGKYNLGFDWVFMPASKVKDNCKKLLGAEHVAGLQQHETLVLVYADKDETIEGTIACSKEDMAVVGKGEVVADFTLPYRCCETEVKAEEPKTSLTITVISCNDKTKPVGGASIVMGGEKTETDATGKAEIKLSPDKYQINIGKQGFSEVTDTILVEKTDFSKEYTMTPATADLEGTVQNGNNPAISVNIVVNGKPNDTLTDAEGKFRMENLPANTPIEISIGVTGGRSKTFIRTLNPCSPESHIFQLFEGRKLPEEYWGKYFEQIKLNPTEDKAIKTREFFEKRMEDLDAKTKVELGRLEGDFDQVNTIQEATERLAFDGTAENTFAAAQMIVIAQAASEIFTNTGVKNQTIITKSAKLAFGAFLDRAFLNAPLAFENQPEQVLPIHEIFKKINDSETGTGARLFKIQPGKIAEEWVATLEKTGFATTSFIKGLMDIINNK